MELNASRAETERLLTVSKNVLKRGFLLKPSLSFDLFNTVVLKL
jgi:hypothetical protein